MCTVYVCIHYVYSRYTIYIKKYKSGRKKNSKETTQSMLLTRIRSADGSKLLSVLMVITLTSACVAAEFLNKKLMAAFNTRSSTSGSMEK